MGNFVVFIIVLFALAALLRIDFFFTILYLFIGVYLVTRFWSHRMLKALKISRRVQERAFLGETIDVSLTVENLGHLPVPWLMITETFSDVLSTPSFLKEVITLGGKSSYKINYQLTARRRGYYNIGPLVIEAGDLLAITQKMQEQFEPDHIIIYPKILQIAQPKLPTFSPQVVMPTPVPLFQDPNRVIGVRNYIEGDNPRYIHWPATATTGQMLVKQFQTAIARESIIFLNMDRAEYGRPGQADIAIELAIVAAASLASHIVTTEELSLGLATVAFDPLTNRTQPFKLSPNRGQSHLMQILEVLARIEGIDKEIFLKNLQRESVHLSWGTTIIIITNIESDSLLQAVLLLKRAGFHVTTIFVQPAAYNYPEPHRVRELNVTAYRITREKDLETWQPLV